ncbi:hypothetical protein ACIP1T_24300 [Pseudomonas japonica]|uniref:hypothetical protein n=1 Tax=Pseudomonas TaxID=286 RepID=UPI00292A3A95|nr:hypothetical protein [Pseudomonas sp. zfem002]MDU9393440.1 hypothetical protein [Pseudomonas sp. zfem002]
MKRTPAALVLISPHHLRQALFLLLALLLTLVAGQLHHAWQARQVDSQLAVQVVRIHESRALPLQTAPVMGSRALPAASVDTTAPRERWVF